MSVKVIFYHAGCPVCASAEQILYILDRKKIDLEIVHLVTAKNRIAEAEEAGVRSVPAFVINGEVLHINFGTSIEELKESPSSI